MLATVIRSEFVFNRKAVFIYAIVTVLLNIVYSIIESEPGFAAGLTAIYISLLPAIFLSRSSKFKVDGIACIFPVTRSTFIKGKYLFALICIGGGFILLILLSVIRFAPVGTLGLALTANRLVNLIFVVSLVSGILIPCIVRYGYNGVFAFMIGAQALSIVLFILTFIGIIGNALRFIMNDIPGFFIHLRGVLGAPGYHLLILFIAGGVTYVSMIISVLIYQKKEF